MSVQARWATGAGFGHMNNSENFDASLSDDGRYRLLVEAISDYAIYMLDPNGVVTNWNTGAQRFKGYLPKEIVGRNFEVFYTAEDRALGRPSINLRRAADEGRLEDEGWRVRKDGSRFWAHVVIDRILAPDGSLVGFAKITRDLTERRHVQQELEQAREALFQAQKMESIGQLTGGIAHDFNNLLMAIIGSLEIVQRRINADPAISPFIDNALKGARRGAVLTQRMLAFARRQELKMGTVDLKAVVGGMTDLLERTLGPSIYIRQDLPDDLPPVRTDGPHRPRLVDGSRSGRTVGRLSRSEERAGQGDHGRDLAARSRKRGRRCPNPTRRGRAAAAKSQDTGGRR
ncbi:PAS domain S-box protein [Devosia sp. LjRoot16]